MLTACATAPKQPACSCAQYQTQTPKPAWVEADIVNDSELVTQGATHCTGVKSLDFNKADQNARVNLSFILRSVIEGETEVIRRDDGSGGGRSNAQTRTQQSTHALIENSQIFDRWVDATNCTIHSGVRVTRKDLQATQEKQQARERSKLINQPIEVQSRGFLAERGKQLLLKQLSDLGAQKLQSTEPSYTFILKTQPPLIVQEDALKAVTITTDIQVTAPDKTIVYSATHNGKAIVLSNSNQQYAEERALKNAFIRIKMRLDRWLNQPIKPKTP